MPKNSPIVIAAMKKVLEDLSKKSDEELAELFENQELGDIGRFILDMTPSNNENISLTN